MPKLPVQHMKCVLELRIYQKEVYIKLLAESECVSDPYEHMQVLRLGGTGGGPEQQCTSVSVFPVASHPCPCGKVIHCSEGMLLSPYGEGVLHPLDLCNYIIQQQTCEATTGCYLSESKCSSTA